LKPSHWPVGIFGALTRGSQVRRKLSAGASRIRTLGPSLSLGPATTGPHNGIALGAIHSVRAVCLPASEGVGRRVRIRLPPAESHRTFGPSTARAAASSSLRDASEYVPLLQKHALIQSITARTQAERRRSRWTMIQYSAAISGIGTVSRSEQGMPVADIAGQDAAAGQGRPVSEAIRLSAPPPLAASAVAPGLSPARD
jgi:hypothetical protein